MTPGLVVNENMVVMSWQSIAVLVIGEGTIGGSVLLKDWSQGRLQ